VIIEARASSQTKLENISLQKLVKTVKDLLVFTLFFAYNEATLVSIPLGKLVAS
jgi:hypothetical protein